jgi:hypothetical protein
VVPGRMTTRTKINEKLHGVDNFMDWRYKITLLLEEYDLDMFIKEEFQEPEGNEVKEKHKKDMVKAKGLLQNPSRTTLSIIYHHYLLQIK